MIRQWERSQISDCIPKKHIAMGKSHEVTYDYDLLSLIHKDKRQEEVWPKAVQELFRGTKLFWYRSWTGMMVLSSKLHVVLMQPRSEWRCPLILVEVGNYTPQSISVSKKFLSRACLYHSFYCWLQVLQFFLFYLPLCACSVPRFTLGILYTELIHKKKRGDCHC